MVTDDEEEDDIESEEEIFNWTYKHSVYLKNVEIFIFLLIDQNKISLILKKKFKLN